MGRDLTALGGMAVLTLVSLIPIVGGLVVIVLAFAAGGAALFSRFGEPGPAAGPDPAAA